MTEVGDKTPIESDKFLDALMLRTLENPMRSRELSKWPKHWHDLVLEVVQNFELDIDGIVI